MKRIAILLIAVQCSFCALMAQDNNPQQGRRPQRQRYVIPTDAPTQTKQKDGTIVINTAALCKEVRGYRDLTPVEIHVRKGKVVKVEALRNNEGPKYMDMCRPILEKWNGKKVADAQKLKVDAVTGATYTSNALIENVQEGLKYYSQKK